MVFEVDDATFEARVLKNPLPVLVDCWAPSCKPCLSMHPVFESLAAAYDGRLAVAKINVDENAGTAKAFSVRSLPTLLLMHEGKVLDKKLGAMSESQITDWIGTRLDM